ncbi:DNA primase [Heliorestis acidaminivorans]|uniref:DNA primase n=1 Tax=Heliorestis acidaminivorans TaxID=553427 RepID=A0A6I0EXQ5_9FIRM|nr:DNA primase [Heliorestis acidaminivorans]KAB2954579.1 DNA primase [Heliorestis acidaminivorans]
MRDPQIIEDVRHRIDIVELISQYLPLKRQGNRFVGLCPFHQEKTPSFSVSQDKQFFHCFGCGTGGDVFTFVMLQENLTFPESLKKLAEQAGVSLPEAERTPAQEAARRTIEKGRALHKRTAELFFQCLREDSRGLQGRDYLHRRGVSDSVAVAFGLGFAPQQWDFLTERLLREGYSTEELEQFGLALRRAGGEGHYDRFRNRLIFPIFDGQGRPIAFGGRVLGDEMPKYLNSPETPLYKKGQHLYGLHKAGPFIREKGMAILVEGYMDVITCHQHGVTQAVATLGTALTIEQGRLLLRYGSSVLICYDGDRAGTAATIKAGRILTELGAKVKVLHLQEAKDPDEFLQSQGASKLWQAIDKAPTYIEYRYKQAHAQQNLNSVEGKVATIRELAPDLLSIPSAVEQEANVQWLAKQVGISDSSIIEELRSLSHSRPTYSRDRKENPWHTNSIQTNISQDSREIAGASTAQKALTVDEGKATSRLEEAWRYLIYWMIGDVERINWVLERMNQEIPELHDPIKEIVESLIKLGKRGSSSAVRDLTESLRTDQARNYLSALLVDEPTPDWHNHIIEDCINTLKYGWLIEEISRLEGQINRCYQEQDDQELRHLLPQLAKLQQLRSRAGRIHGTVPLGGRQDQRSWSKGGTTDERRAER